MHNSQCSGRMQSFLCEFAPACHKSISCLACGWWFAGPVRTTPEDPVPAEETADSDPGGGAHPVEEEAATGWQRGSS